MGSLWFGKRLSILRRVFFYWFNIPRPSELRQWNCGMPTLKCCDAEEKGKRKVKWRFGTSMAFRVTYLLIYYSFLLSILHLLSSCIMQPLWIVPTYELLFVFNSQEVGSRYIELMSMEYPTLHTYMSRCLV